MTLRSWARNHRGNLRLTRETQEFKLENAIRRKEIPARCTARRRLALPGGVSVGAGSVIRDAGCSASAIDLRGDERERHHNRLQRLRQYGYYSECIQWFSGHRHRGGRIPVAERHKKCCGFQWPHHDRELGF